MHLSKARELYSDYQEGTLSPAMRQAFEQALEKNSEIRADYAEFVRVMGAFDAFAQKDLVEIPPLLHERISARIDQAEWEASRKKQSGFSFGFWRPAFYGAVGTLAIVGALYSLRVGNNGPVATASLTPGQSVVAPAAGPSAQYDNQQFSLMWTSEEPVTVVLTEKITGQEVETFRDLRGDITLPLRNDREDAVILRIENAGQAATTVALPGTMVTMELQQGEGTVAEFILALSQTYGELVYVPISLDTSRRVRWNFEQSDPIAAATPVLRDLELNIERRTPDMLVITN